MKCAIIREAGFIGMSVRFTPLGFKYFWAEKEWEEENTLGKCIIAPLP
jgi:hypothetical protein